MNTLRQKLDKLLDDFSVYDILYELSRMYRERTTSNTYPAMWIDGAEIASEKARILENAITDMESLDSEDK